MTIAELEPTDPVAGELLAALHARVFADAWPAAAFQALLQIPGTLALVLLDNGSPTGFVVARCVLDEGEIITIGVLADHQRRGHARRLMEEVRLRAGAIAVKSLFLEVSAANMAARALYECLGFTPVGRRKGYYQRSDGPPDDALVLQLSLQPSGPGSAPDDNGVSA